MKQWFGFVFLVYSWVCYGQHPYELIPKSASIVLTVNNIAVLQKVSLDQLIQYDFMIDMQQELFDGSAKGKTIKDVGINFDQKLSVFFGRTTQYELSGFAFGVEDTAKLLSVFHHFTPKHVQQPDVVHLVSYFNHLVLKGNVALLFRLEALSTFVTPITDSIWSARGNSSSFNWEHLDYKDDPIELPIEDIEEKILTVETEEMLNEQHIFSDSNQHAWLQTTQEEEPHDRLSGKTFWELLDSVTIAQQDASFAQVIHQLFVDKESLYASDTHFSTHLNNDSDAVFYLDNSRNVKRNFDMWYAQTLLPNLYQELSDLYTDNVVLGEIHLQEHAIKFDFTTHYGEKLGSIYRQLTDAKFDKNILKYIHKDCPNFFSYTVNLQKAYQQAYEVVVPLLEKENNTNIVMKLITLEILDELIDKKALFGVYKGSMFGTFNGSKSIVSKEFIYRYDDQTWEYFEEEIEKERNIPIFTLGFSTERPDIIIKILSRISRATNQIEKKESYWIIRDAIASSMPLYLILQNGLFMFSNDEDLVVHHLKGYGSNAVSGKKAKQIQKNGLMYAELNSQQMVDMIVDPHSSHDSLKHQQILSSLQNNTGKLQITSSKTTDKKTNFHALYSFDGTYTSSSRYILDFVNNLYILSK